MRKLLSLILLAIAASSVVLVAPASAGDGYWSPSGCEGGRRAHEGDWWGVPGQGAWYRSNASGWSDQWVGGSFHSKYAQMGYECGVLGFPTGGLYDVGAQGGGLYPPGQYFVQPFEYGELQLYYGTFYWCSYAHYQCYRV